MLARMRNGVPAMAMTRAKVIEMPRRWTAAAELAELEAAMARGERIRPWQARRLEYLRSKVTTQ
jgi:hypothetical protein